MLQVVNVEFQLILRIVSLFVLKIDYRCTYLLSGNLESAEFTLISERILTRECLILVNVPIMIIIRYSIIILSTQSSLFTLSAKHSFIYFRFPFVSCSFYLFRLLNQNIFANNYLMSHSFSHSFIHEYSIGRRRFWSKPVRREILMGDNFRTKPQTNLLKSYNNILTYILYVYIFFIHNVCTPQVKY